MPGIADFMRSDEATKTVAGVTITESRRRPATHHRRNGFMKPQQATSVSSAGLVEMLADATAGRLWEFPGPGARRPDTASRVAEALRDPAGFPPVTEATVPGDRIALAVDPNVPELASVLRGCVATLWKPGEPPIEIVCWEEATGEAIDGLATSLRDLDTSAKDSVRVHRHRAADRGSLSYLAADASANPIYLSRVLVDADFVLPVVAHRSLDRTHQQDPTGLFPNFSDSSSRRRFLGLDTADRSAPGPLQPGPLQPGPLEVDWLLGVLVMLAVRPDADGNAGDVWAGTPQAINDAPPFAETSSPEPPGPAPLVVACLDGDEHQQTWGNVTRALAAARRFVSPGGTIVLWTGLAGPPPQGLAGDEESIHESDDSSPLPPWDEAAELAPTLQAITAEHRVLLHSRLDPDLVESMSLGVIDRLDELRRVSAGHESVGLLRAAQFAGTTLHPIHPSTR